MDKNINN